MKYREMRWLATGPSVAPKRQAYTQSARREYPTHAQDTVGGRREGYALMVDRGCGRALWC